jgi:DNA segregation ATPase FtsK/SpoIIIE, S-DNA-T family
MRVLGPTPFPRLNEAVGMVCLLGTIFFLVALVSYQPGDASFNTAAPAAPAQNLAGRVGSHIADLALQSLGLAAFLIPGFLIVLAWKWLRSLPIPVPAAKLAGFVLFVCGAAATLSLGPSFSVFGGYIRPGGTAGVLLAEFLLAKLNLVGSVLLTSTCLLISLYLVSSFSVYRLPDFLLAPWHAVRSSILDLHRWMEERRRRKEEAQASREGRTPRRRVEVEEDDLDTPPRFRTRIEAVTEPSGGETEIPIRTLEDMEQVAPEFGDDEPPFDADPDASGAGTPHEPAVVEYIPPPPSLPLEEAGPLPLPEPTAARRPERPAEWSFPPTGLLSEAEARSPYDAQELKDIASRIKAKFEEFKILGSVVQINPGPVVTTFEYKPEAGIKYSKITTLTEDLCLGLHAESILIERIPGKPTIGIEVPNSKREVIALRQILESDEFRSPASKLTISLGKDINGRIKTASLENMPHLLIAGSTGSGKSVMLNCLIMSVLYKATPDEVRLILVDPKQVEMGVYEGIPHLLTPVITKPELATNALRNAVHEMERRLKMLAAQGVRNIDQYNRKIRQKMQGPLSLFEDAEQMEDPLQPLSYILIVIDELADLMIQERANVETSITRLAQMARAVGIHLVVATQRPSVDVITGLIKANFPARVSFRVATKIDSRTILDGMGAEHLLGKGDMLFLPPGSARLVRVHSAYCTEAEIADVVNFWKRQAAPDYDKSYLLVPPGEGEDGEASEDLDSFNDPMYEEAVRTVLEMGKASTSILQRRLRLGYGRAARILDVMYKDGIIGPPDGSRPREVLKRPDWLREVQDQVR